MSFYIRYVLTDDRPVNLGELERALRQVDPAYAVDGYPQLKPEDIRATLGYAAEMTRTGHPDSTGAGIVMKLRDDADELAKAA